MLVLIVLWLRKRSRGQGDRFSSSGKLEGGIIVLITSWHARSARRRSSEDKPVDVRAEGIGGEEEGDRKDVRKDHRGKAYEIEVAQGCGSLCLVVARGSHWQRAAL
jgi:hypothetical protein